MTFLICVTVVLVWAVSGPMFGFSETWQLVINTGATIVTFLMVFLTQNTQDRARGPLPDRAKPPAAERRRSHECGGTDRSRRCLKSE